MKNISLTLSALVAGLALLAGYLYFSSTPIAAYGASDPITGLKMPGDSFVAYPPPDDGNDPPPNITVVDRYYLPLVAGNPPAPEYDMLDFMANGGGVLYEVRHSSGAQARHQTQYAGTRFFHTKGNEINAEWEELWGTEELIYRGTDTSPGSGQYYTLYENDVAGSAWSPRVWRVGDLYERDPYVVFYRKSDCEIVASGFQRSWLRFEAYYPSYVFESGLKLDRVIELTWLLQPDGVPIESYFYAANFGLVGWGSADRGTSGISEIHAPGQRPDNKRESVSCIASQGNRLVRSADLNYGPLPAGFRAK